MVIELAPHKLYFHNLCMLPANCRKVDITTKRILKDALLEYTGSLLIISHDRAFLDGLVSKVYELRNGTIHVHMGSFGDFLEKKAAILHGDTAEVETNGASLPRQEEGSSQKQQYLLRKELNARKRKLYKRNSKYRGKDRIIGNSKEGTGSHPFRSHTL